MDNTVHKLIIIGSGPAGLTAAIYASRANLNPLLIEGKAPGGQLMGTSFVENWPGEEKILGPQLMMKMRDHAKLFGTIFVSEEVTKVDFSQQPFSLWTHRGTHFKAETVIVATGAVSKRLGIPGEDIYWGKGVTTCAVCDGAFYKDKEVIIVGGGDTAMEDASFMTKFTDKITVIQVSEKLSATYAMQERVLNNPKIKILCSSTLSEIKGNGTHVTHAVIKNGKTGEISEKTVDGIFIAIGLNPNTKIFEGQLALNPYGYLNVTDHTKTSIQGIFAAGDVFDYRYRQAITSAGSGCMAALDAEKYLASKE